MLARGPCRCMTCRILHSASDMPPSCPADSNHRLDIPGSHSLRELPQEAGLPRKSHTSGTTSAFFLHPGPEKNSTESPRRVSRLQSLPLPEIPDWGSTWQPYRYSAGTGWTPGYTLVRESN